MTVELQDSAQLLSILAIGFVLGYFVRAAISHHQRNEARQLLTSIALILKFIVGEKVSKSCIGGWFAVEA